MYVFFPLLGIVNIKKITSSSDRWGPSHFLVHLFQNVADRFLSRRHLKGGAWRKIFGDKEGAEAAFKIPLWPSTNMEFRLRKMSVFTYQNEDFTYRRSVRTDRNADQWSRLHVFLAEKKGDLRTEVGPWGFGPKKSGEERKFTREWGYQDVMPLQPQIAKDLFWGFRFGHLFLAPFLVGTCLSTRCLKGIWNRSETITSHTLKGGFFSWMNPGKWKEMYGGGHRWHMMTNGYMWWLGNRPWYLDD